MNLLMVDDEKIAIDGIISSSDWSGLGIDRVFSAYSAREARHIIETSSIDIIVCDIEMPGESGISLLEWLSKRHPDIVPVILTSHARFAYAQHAISLGISGYLLKPVPSEDLELELGKCIDKVSEKNRIRRMIQLSEKPDDTEEGGPTDKETLVDKVVSYVERNLSEEISRSDIAGTVFMNADYVAKCFKKKMGVSITEYISGRRIEKAKEYLLGTGLSVKEISSMVGFSNFSYFNLVFRKTVGMTPTGYRNSKGQA